MKDRWTEFVFHKRVLWLNCTTFLDTSDSVRLSEASIIALFIWQTLFVWQTNKTNQANTILRFSTKCTNASCSILVRSKCLPNKWPTIVASNYRGMKISSMKDGVIHKLNIMAISLRSVHRDFVCSLVFDSRHVTTKEY